MRIGVDAGSLEPGLPPLWRALLRDDGRERAHHAEIFEDNDFFEFKISYRISDVFLAVAALLKNNQTRSERDIFRLSSIVLVQPTKPANGGFTPGDQSK